MRIILAILCVLLFGVVAVSTTSGSGPLPAVPAVAPRYTPMPSVAAMPPDVGERGARTYMRLWGMFALPIEGGEIPQDLELLPGAPRDYRGGIHEGIDFPAPSETPVLAAASGTVVRIDSSFVDWNREQQDMALDEALTLGYSYQEPSMAGTSKKELKRRDRAYYRRRQQTSHAKLRHINSHYGSHDRNCIA